MKDLPWFTIATMLTAASTMLQGMVGDLPPEWSAGLTVAVVVLGGIGKAAYNVGEGLKGSNEPVNE